MAFLGSGLIGLDAKDDGDSREQALAPDAGQVGLWAFLATVTMLFAGFTSAILVRRTMPDWQPIPVPGLLWWNTAVLLASSATMERVRRLARRERWGAAKNWLLGTMLLGLLFLIGQLGAWRQLAAQGLYLASNPHNSFFYILSGTHGVHLFGGLLALVYLLARFFANSPAEAPRRAAHLCATYWHFLGGLWIYLFLVLFVV